MLPDAYYLGYPKMDCDHEILFDLFRQLADIAQAGTDRLQLAFIQTHGRLCAHFRMEESLMGEHAYPGMSDHEQQHNEMRAQLDCLSVIVYRGCAPAAAYGIKMIAMSLLAHLDVADRDLAKYLLGRDPSVRQEFQCDGESGRLTLVRSV